MVISYYLSGENNESVTIISNINVAYLINIVNGGNKSSAWHPACRNINNMKCAGGYRSSLAQIYQRHAKAWRRGVRNYSNDRMWRKQRNQCENGYHRNECSASWPHQLFSSVSQ